MKRQMKNFTHIDLIPIWINYMKAGMIDGRAFSPSTISNYTFYLRYILAKHKTLSEESLKLTLMTIDPERFAVREMVYRAGVCFGKFLIHEKYLNASFLNDVKYLRPRRHKPSKKISLTEQQFLKMFEHCNNLLDKLILVLLFSTGLRASEACRLRLCDINFEEGSIKILCSKWGKSRSVGLSKALQETLREYLKSVEYDNTQDFLLTNKQGEPLTRHGLYKRLKRIGSKAGIDVSPHACRRGFVTENVKKGRPLVYLQIACGHSNITTTRSYCLTTEQEVIDEMQNW